MKVNIREFDYNKYILDVKLGKGKGDAVYMFFEDELKKKRLPEFLPKNVRELLKEAKAKGFSAERDEVYMFPEKGVAFVGVGKEEEITPDFLRRAAAIAFNRLKRDLIFHPNPSMGDDKDHTYFITEGVVLSNFKFSMKSEEKEKKEKRRVWINVSDTKENRAELERAKILAEAHNFSRYVANLPPNIATPEGIVEIAKGLAKEYGLKITVYDKKKLEKMGANAILAVNAGSGKGAYIVKIEYKGGNKSDIGVVGKGITFDSGGLGIKPGKYMLTMKLDKTGAAVVLGILRGVAELKLPVRVVGYLALTENMPGQNAYKPGDIVRALNGKTIEVLHTDAEGRMALADALSMASKESHELIVDFATLTGAIDVALGEHAIGGFSNTDRFTFFEDAGIEEYEIVWEMPLFKEYGEMIKSEVADVKNLGSWEGSAGSITAAKFLEEFVGEKEWIHFDIAGVYMRNLPYLNDGKIGTAPGVRLFLNALIKMIDAL